MRTAEINRKTAETEIAVKLNLDGRGSADISTGVGFLDHMLELFARHGRFDLDVKCTGDTHVDDHHTTEDVGIALGAAFARALGDKKGISRYGSAIIPMDESLILTAVDFSGRSYLGYPDGESRRLRYGTRGGVLARIYTKRCLYTAHSSAGGDEFPSHH